MSPSRTIGAALILACSFTQTPEGAAEDKVVEPSPIDVASAVDQAILRDVFEYDESQIAPRCDDATYLRRVWLDVVGDIPTPEHAIAFALDTTDDKRQRVVRELLADPQYGVNWARYWRDVIFFRRLEDRALIAANALEADLSQRLNENVAWSEIAAEFITAAGDVRENGLTAIFMAQDGRTEESTAEISRIFLGMQIQCAQCHDHPYDRWKREQFHELAAFFPRVGVRNLRTATKRSYEVYAVDRTMRRARSDNSKLPTPQHVMPNLENPSFPGAQMTPTFFLTGAKLPLSTYDARRRATLAEWLTDNDWFATALANRIWSELVGEGFYEPVDDIGPDREAAAADAIGALAEGFRDRHYDLKWLIETICATEAYQRESRPRRTTDERPFAANVAQPLRGDQLYNAALSALDMDASQTARGGNYRRDQQRGVSRTGFNAEFAYDPSQQRDTITRSIPQTLAMMNSTQFNEALGGGRSVVARLEISGVSDQQLIVELYLRCLSRQPTADELAIASQHLSAQEDRGVAAADLAWALINSAEFQHRR